MADNNTILEKLEGLVARFEEVSTLITDPAVIADQKRYVKLTKEYKELGDLMNARKEYMQVLSGIEEAKEIIANETDAEMRANLNWKSRSNCCLSPPTRRTAAMLFLKSAVVQAVTKQLFLPETFSACTPSTAKQKAGNWIYPAPMRAQPAVSKKSSVL